MRELRTQENERFQKFFEIVRSEALREGCIFFADCGEGRDIFTDDMEGEDLSGWLIPTAQADEFEREWLGYGVDDKWDTYMRLAVWDDSNGRIRVSFKEF